MVGTWMGDHLELPRAVSINFFLMDIASRVSSYVERTAHTVNHVRYFGVIFNRRITWRVYTKATEVKSCRTL